MKIAIIGGTHGNEPVGLEVIRILKEESRESFKNEFSLFQGNPKAFELQKRFVDSDLNRAFGKNAIRQGYEKKRAEELEVKIKGHFDLCIDLHTTTTNMGLTLILNNTHPTTQYACAYLQSLFPDIKLIEEDRLDEECNHLNRLAPAGITIEVGPVANNVIRGDLVMHVYKMVCALLRWNFDYNNINLDETEFYKVIETLYYPNERGWYIHQGIEDHDFKPIKRGAPLFINHKGDVKKFDGHDGDIYPFFINEAAYLRNRSAMILSVKKKGLVPGT